MRPALQWRYATKAFDAGRRIPAETWAALEQSQSQVTEADLDQLISAISGARGVPPEQLAGYRELMVKDPVHGPRSERIGTWASNQVSIALGTFMAAAALLGKVRCPAAALIEHR